MGLTGAGFAAILVVLGHFLLYWIKDSPWPVFGIEFLSAVSLFFVISGFTFTVIYGGDKASYALLSWGGFLAFLRKRVARLAPVYYVGLVIGIAPLILYESSSAQNLALNVVFACTMLQSVTLQGMGFDGPLWTVSAFAVCYCMFPLFLRLFRPLSLPTLIWWFRGLSLLTAVSSVGVLSGVSHFFFAWRVPQFVLGIVAALIATRSPPSSRPILVTELCSAALALNFAVTPIVAYYFGATTWQVLMTVMEFVVTGTQAWWIMGLTTPLPKHSGAFAGGLTRVLFKTAPLRWLGNVSYALYCTHFVVFYWCAFAVGGGVSSTAVPVRVRYVNGTILPATTPLPPGATYGWWFFPGWAIFPCVAVCLVVAVLVWFSLERPARAAISHGVSTSGLGTALTQDNVAPCSDVVQPVQVAAMAPAPAPLGPIVEMA